MTVLTNTDKESVAPPCQHVQVSESCATLACALPTSIDRPAGRIEGAVSAVTGKPLRYFVPDPLPELLDRCRTPHRQRSTSSDPHLSFMLARAASRRDLNGQVDTAQAMRFCEIVARRRTYESETQLMELGRCISSRNTELREEIVYSGARTPSEAEHIFAPDSMLPALMDSLVQTLTDDPDGVDPSFMSAIVGFYCVRMHPFLDGNGRWARLVAASAGMRMAAAMPVMASVVFQNVCKAELIKEVWPAAMAYGLRKYVSLVWRFESELMASLTDSGLLASVINFNAEITKAAKSPRNFHLAAFPIYSNQEIPLTELKKLFGMSARAFSGFIERLSIACNDFIDVNGNKLSIEPLLSRVDQSIANARKSAFNRDEYNG